MDEMLDHNVQAGLKGRKAWYTQEDRSSGRNSIQKNESQFLASGAQSSTQILVNQYDESFEKQNCCKPIKPVFKSQKRMLSIYYPMKIEHLDSSHSQKSQGDRKKKIKKKKKSVYILIYSIKEFYLVQREGYMATQQAWAPLRLPMSQF
uniref:Uncharacterized protein n=1 Tax=Pipistrellus kuhlii TaxID=59472 RepID=A0A7J7X083_PIPKU|nr:hypothetical protein mPipKuh1_010761 [Pipistrellus kuhlii]